MSSSQYDEQTLLCSSCQSVLGHVHSSSGGYKLRKARLSLSRSSPSPFESFDANKWLSCHLLSSIDGQGVRKFLISNTSTNTAALKIWIFTPDINVSSSASKQLEPIRAVKILWLDATALPQNDGVLNRQALSEGELELPPHEFEAMREALVNSANLLPGSGRKFQSWNVALLPRFKSEEVQPHRSITSPPVTLPEVPDIENKEALSALTT